MSEIELVKQTQTLTFSLLVDSQVVKQIIDDMKAEGWQVEKEVTNYRDQRVFIDLVRFKNGKS